MALGLILTSGPLFAFDYAKEAKVLFCRQSETFGLYEQCEEVKVMAEMGDSFRVFGLATKRVTMVNRRSIFLAKSIAATRKMVPNTIVAIPATNLWNNSKIGFFGRCVASPIVKNENLLNVPECGRYINATIQRDHVYQMEPMPVQIDQSTSDIQKDSLIDSPKSDHYSKK